MTYYHNVHTSATAENNDKLQNHLKMSNYHLMVRSKVLRERFKNSFEFPEPFVANKKTDVNIKLPDIFHTFKKGHKLQIQAQSTNNLYFRTLLDACTTSPVVLQTGQTMGQLESRCLMALAVDN